MELLVAARSALSRAMSRVTINPGVPEIVSRVSKPPRARFDIATHAI